MAGGRGLGLVHQRGGVGLNREGAGPRTGSPEGRSWSERGGGVNLNGGGGASVNGGGGVSVNGGGGVSLNGGRSLNASGGEPVRVKQGSDCPGSSSSTTSSRRSCDH